MSELNLTIDTADVDLIERSLAALPHKIAVAERAAVGKTLDTMRGRIRKSLAAKIGIRQRVIGTGKRGFIRLTRTPSNDEPSGVLRIYPKRIPLDRLRPSRNPGGLTGRVFGGSADFPHAFLTRMKGKSYRFAMVRRGAGRLPIKRVMGTDLVTALDRDNGLSSAIQEARRVLHTNVESQISRFLKARASRV